MKILVLGAGKQGGAAAFDLLRSPQIEAVGIADQDGEALESLRVRLADPRVQLHQADAFDHATLVELLRPCDACINAMSSSISLDVTRAAIEAGIHLCDLGGSSEVVSQQLKLDTAAFEKGVTVVPDCGLAPGLATILAAHGIRRLDETHSVHIRVGQLPQKPKPPLNFLRAYPTEALMDRYSQRAVIIRDGVRLSVEPLTEVETIEFPEPYGNLEAFNTSGGLSTLASTFAGKVRNLDFKSIRYPGHCATLRPLLDLGFFQRQALPIGAAEVSPREITAKLLEEQLKADPQDVVLLRVTIVGAKFGGRRRLEYELIDVADEARDMTAGMRCTGFTASVVVQLLAQGAIDRHGVVPPERCVPAEVLIEELRQRGLDLVQRQS
jgi:lysine 6-dehydrogenase